MTAPCSISGVSNGIAGLAEGDADQFDHHVAEPERQQQRIVDAAAVQRPDQDAFDREAEQADRQRHRDQADPEISAEREDVDTDIGADHVKRTVGEVDHGQHAEDQRKTDRKQHVDRAQRQAGKQLQSDQIEAQTGHALPQKPVRADNDTRRFTTSGFMTEFLAAAQICLIGLVGADDVEDIGLHCAYPSTST